PTPFPYTTLFRSVAFRMLIANDYHEVPCSNFSKFRTFILDSEKVVALGPICDLDILKRTFLQHTNWFDLVTSGIVEGKKGVRASLEHRPTRLFMGQSEVNGAQQVTTYLYSTHSDVPRVDLLSLLEPNVEDFCSYL